MKKYIGYTVRTAENIAVVGERINRAPRNLAEKCQLHLAFLVDRGETGSAA